MRKKLLALAMVLTSFSSFAADSYRVQVALQKISSARIQLEQAENELRIALSGDTQVISCSFTQPLGVVEGTGSTVELAKKNALKNCMAAGYTADSCQRKVLTADCIRN